MALVNITYNGGNGEFEIADFDTPDNVILQMAVEAINSNALPGVTATNANLTGFIVDRIATTQTIVIRPKTPFGNDA